MNETEHELACRAADERAYQKVKALKAFVLLCRSQTEVDQGLSIVKHLGDYAKLPEIPNP